MVRWIVRAALRPLEARQQSCQRRAKVVRDGIANPFDFVHESLDIVEHPVDDHHEPAHFVALGGKRKPPRQVAFHHYLDRRRPIVEPAHGSRTERGRARHADRKHGDFTEYQGVQQFFVEVVNIARYLALQRATARIQALDDATRRGSAHALRGLPGGSGRGIRWPPQWPRSPSMPARRSSPIFQSA